MGLMALLIRRVGTTWEQRYFINFCQRVNNSSIFLQDSDLDERDASEQDRPGNDTGEQEKRSQLSKVPLILNTSYFHGGEYSPKNE